MSQSLARELTIVSGPVKKSYKPAEQIDFTGLCIELEGKNVTNECQFSVAAGTEWKKDWKELDVVASLEDAEVQSCTFTLCRKSRLAMIFAIIGGFFAVLLAILLIASALNGVTPPEMILNFADSIGITQTNSDAHAVIEGTTSFQSPRGADKKWKAGSTSQHFTMANPEGNTVALSPHIYIDTNKDGNFTEDECVYNAITYNDKGEVSSYGLFIDVGRQIDDIEITKPIDAGTYRAKVSYTAVDKETKSLCNGNDFVFDMVVE